MREADTELDGVRELAPYVKGLMDAYAVNSEFVDGLRTGVDGD